MNLNRIKGHIDGFYLFIFIFCITLTSRTNQTANHLFLIEIHRHYSTIHLKHHKKNMKNSPLIDKTN